MTYLKRMMFIMLSLCVSFASVQSLAGTEKQKTEISYSQIVIETLKTYSLPITVISTVLIANYVANYVLQSSRDAAFAASLDEHFNNLPPFHIPTYDEIKAAELGVSVEQLQNLRGI